MDEATTATLEAANGDVTAPDLATALATLAEGAALLGAVSQGFGGMPPGERAGALVAPILAILRDRLGFDIAWIALGGGDGPPGLVRCTLGPALAGREAATYAPAIGPVLADLPFVPRKGGLPPGLRLADPATGETHPAITGVVAELGLRAVLAVPLLPRQEERVIGAMVVGTRAPAMATGETLTLVGLLGSQLGTALSHAEGLERLRLSEERARVVMEEATDSIYMLDVDGNFSYANPQIEHHLGYRPDELIGRHFSAVVVPERVPRVQESLRRAEAGEADATLADLDLRRKDGIVRTFEISARNLYDPQVGRYTGRFGIARDITERRRLETELARRTRALEALNTIATRAGRSAVPGPAREPADGPAKDLDGLLNEALDRTLAVFKLEQGAICLLDREGHELTLAVHRGYGEDFIARIARLRADTPLAELILTTERPILGSDLARDVPMLAAAADRARIGKYGCVPLRAQERVLGVLFVSGADERALSPSDGDTLAIVGAQLGAAIENARLAGEAAASRAGLEVTTEQLRRLLAVSAGFAANTPLDAVLNTVASAIVETLGFGSAHVRVRSEDGGALVGVGFCGYEPAQEAALRGPTSLNFYNRLLDPRFRLGGVQYIPHHVDRQATFGTDWTVVRRSASLDWQPGQWHPEDALVVPLRGRDGTLLGVIYVDEPLDGAVPDLAKAAILELFGRQAALAIENADLYAQVARDLRRQNALREVIGHISAELDLDRLLEQLLADAVELLGGDAGAFGLIDRETGVSRIGTINNMPEHILHAVINAGQGLTGTIMATGAPAMSGGPAAFAAPGDGQTIHACVGVPVFRGEELVGTFFVGSTDPARRFGRHDIETLELFARHAALALGNARLYEEARAQAARLETLREAIEQISSELDLPALLNRLAVGTVRLLDAEYGAIALIDEESGGARVEAGYNLPPDTIGRELAPGGWLDDLAARVGPLLIGPDSEPPAGMLPHHVPGHAHIVAPIWWQDRLIGIFSLSTGRPEKRFSRADLDTLALLARHAAVAIENAGLYSALQERFSQVEGIGAVGTALIEERDLDSVLGTVAEQIVALLGADGCSIFLLDPDEGARAAGQELELAVVLGVGADALQGRRLPLHGSITGQAILDGRPVLIEGLLDGPPERAPALRVVGIDQLLSLPLQTSERTVGALNAYGRRGKAFGQRDIATMTLFAQQAAVAIENARLHEQGRVLAVAEERNRMAREIHDTLAQGFTGIILQLQVAESLLEGEEPAARERLARAQELARSSLREARRSVWNLRPSSLQGRTLPEALRDYVREWSGHTGVAGGFFVEGDERPLAPETEETLLRVAQEALNNTYKHAGATRAEVTLAIEPAAIRLAVCDDGAGITSTEGGRRKAEDEVPVRGGFGLVSMRERVSRLNGTLDIESAPGQGTCVQVSVADHGPPARREPGSVPG